MSAKAAASKARALWAARALAAKEKKVRCTATPNKLSAIGHWASFEEVAAFEDQHWPTHAIPRTTRKFYQLTGDDRDLYLSNIARVVKGGDGWHYVKRVVLVRDYGKRKNVWRHGLILLPMRKTKRNGWCVQQNDLSAGWSKWSWSRDKGGQPVFEWHIDERLREVPIAAETASLKVYGDEMCATKGAADEFCMSEAQTEASQSDCRSVGLSEASQSDYQSIGWPSGWMPLCSPVI